MDAMKDLRAFILIMVILAFVWLFTGGPLRPSAKSGWFLHKPQQKGEQRAKKEVVEVLGKKVPIDEEEQSKTESKIQTSSSQSLPAGQAGSTRSDFATLKTRRAKETNPDEEYLEIKADKKNKSPMKITGWKLKGKIGLDIAIGKGAPYIHANIANQPQEDIYLKSGEKAIIATGKSPIGTSFKLNKCAGYFEQFHEFAPQLSANCPLLKDEELPSNLNDSCLDYIDRISSCQTVASIPYKYSFKLSSSCQDFITQNANYKTCTENHKDDADFYLPEWRIYLDRSEELWKKKRETITLYDDKNNIIDSKSY